MYGGIALVVAAGGAAFAYARAHPAAETVPAADIYQVGYGNVTQTVGASATVQAPTVLTLGFNGGSGVLQSVNVQIGQTVRRGQVLATLDDASQQIQVMAARAGVMQAQANLTQAEAKLTETEQPATPATISAAQASVAKSRVALAGAEQQLKYDIALYKDRTSSRQQLLSAQNAVTEQKAALQIAQVNMQKAKLQETAALNGSTPQDISVLRNDVTLAEQAIGAANQQLALAQSNLAILQQSLQVAQQNLANDIQSKASATQIQSDEGAVRQAQQGLNGGEGALIQNQSAVQNAQAALVNAEKALADAQPSNGTTAAKIAQNAYDLAQVSLHQSDVQYQAAVASLAVSRAIYNDRIAQQQQVSNARNAVAQAQTGVQGAVAALRETVQPPSAATIIQAKAAVQSAQGSLTSATAQLDTAELAIADMVLKSPIPGVVTQVSGMVGESIGSGATLVTVQQATQGNLQLNIQVPESEIGSVRKGAKVTVTATAYPGQTFGGTITQVYPTPAIVSNVTEYTVLASVHNVNGELQPGMTADGVIAAKTVNHAVVVNPISLVQFGSIQGVYVVGKAPAARSGGRRQFFGGGAGAAGSRGKGFGGGGAFAGGGAGSGAFAGAGGAGGGAFAGGGAGARAGGLRGPQTPYGNNVYFQPVQVGLLGATTVQVVSGLHAGEKILLVPPASAASAASGTGAGQGAAGGGGGGRGFGGRGLGGGLFGG